MSDQTSSIENPNHQTIHTPISLQREVGFIRDYFFCQGIAAPDDFRLRTQEECFQELHDRQRAFSEPIIFRKHFRSCIEKVRESVPSIFSRLLSISPTKNDIDWAEMILKDLLEVEERTAENWIRAACDRFDQRPPDHPQTPDSWMDSFSRPDWRAPKFLLSVLNPRNAYDAHTGWVRLDHPASNRILGALRDYHWMLPLESALAEIVGLTREQVAREASDESGPPASRIDVRIVDGIRILNVSEEQRADEIRRVYPILCETVETARTWVRARSTVPTSEIVRHHFPDLRIASDDEIDRDVIQNPFDQTARSFVLDLLEKHVPGTLSAASIERMTRPFNSKNLKRPHQ